MGNQGFISYFFAAMIAIAGAAYGLGWIDQDALMTLLAVFNGGAVAGLRNGVAKNGGPQPRSFPPGR